MDIVTGGIMSTWISFISQFVHPVGGEGMGKEGG